MTYQASCIFADDIRNELGNKSSIMGVYGRSIDIKSFPVLFAKLCCRINLSTDISAQFSSVKLTIKGNDVLVSEHVVPEDFIANFWKETAAALEKQKLGRSDKIDFVMNIAVSPLKVDERTRLLVTLEVDDDEPIEAGSIEIVLKEQQ